MGKVHQKGTKPERLVRRVATDLGLRYRLNAKNLPGSPDLVNRRRRFAIFVHGCFWHRHNGCSHASTPRRNTSFWTAKFERNKKRDVAAIATLKHRQYRVVVVWECETRHHRVLIERLAPLAVAKHK